MEDPPYGFGRWFDRKMSELRTRRLEEALRKPGPLSVGVAKSYVERYHRYDELHPYLDRVIERLLDRESVSGSCLAVYNALRRIRKLEKEGDA